MGDGLALLITVMFSTAIVITRHSPNLRMTPAVCLGTAMAAVNAYFLSGGLSVSMPDLGWLFLFGAVNLGMGLAMFVTGARLVQAALGALVSTLETVLGPVWVWLIHGEVPGGRTIVGGAIVFGALLIHILTDWRRQRAAGPYHAHPLTVWAFSTTWTRRVKAGVFLTARSSPRFKAPAT